MARDTLALNGEDMVVARETREQQRAAVPVQFKEGPEVEQRADIVLYTQAWDSCLPAKTLEESSAMIRCRVVLNGRELVTALGADVQLGSDFATITIKLHPTSLKIVPLAGDDWQAQRLESV